MWASDPAALTERQRGLAGSPMPDFTFDPAAPVGGCFACFARGGRGRGRAGDQGWAGAALAREARTFASVAVAGEAGGPYYPGLLALREGALLEAAVRALPSLPAVLLVDGTGRDHPRGAGLALHLGAALGVPTVGVTHRPLLAEGDWPADRRGAASPMLLEGRLVGFWVRTRAGARPLAVHAAWGTSPGPAVDVVLAATGRARTPEPLRTARTAARRARAGEASPR
ncbi:MAG: endonuclease V [Actinomycetota bacterium]